MSETGKAIETLRHCLETGDSTGGEEALERITLRLIEINGELAQMKRRIENARSTEWSREFEAGAILPEDVELAKSQR